MFERFKGKLIEGKDEAKRILFNLKTSGIFFKKILNSKYLSELFNIL
jgi:hypothetical protein